MQHAKDDPITEQICTCAVACQKLVNKTINGKLSFNEFVKGLMDLGLGSMEANNYFDKVRQRLELRKGKGPETNVLSREHTPDGLLDKQAKVFRREHDANTAKCDANAAERERAHRNAVEDVAWATLQAKLDQIEKPLAQSNALTFEQFAELFGDNRTTVKSSSLPRSVLNAAPHLVQLQSKVTMADPHIAKQYACKKVVDLLINLGQSQPLKDPILRAMWKPIILDHYVDFEKLYATLEKGYDHQDKPKDFGGGFSLVKKDQATAKCAVHTESDWSRTFDAWLAGVLIFYPH
ncbi:hypothetical protein C0995_005626 [Termitomyces sp. Mi166|nr:hypothetical protein C0995_005626 [Termitomyces sp. Mi166\